VKESGATKDSLPPPLAVEQVGQQKLGTNEIAEHQETAVALARPLPIAMPTGFASSRENQAQVVSPPIIMIDESVVGVKIILLRIS
jgi:hypothetical protein